MPLKDRDARRKYQREYMRRRRKIKPDPPRPGLTRTYREVREVVRMLRASAECADCGWAWPDTPEVMQFDHTDGSKASERQTGGLNRGWTGLARELKRGEFVCANCHTIRTAKRAGRLETTA